MNQSFKLSNQLGFGEELGNAVSHGVGALFMLILLPFSAVYTYNQHDLLRTWGVSIFVISLFLMLLASTIYHVMTYNSIHKYILRIIDHAMIYIAIAGSYTPVALSLVGGWLGYSIVILQWAITLFGILYKILAPRVNEKFSLFLYLSMGWLVVLIIKPLIAQASLSFLIMMVAGGLCYTFGAYFYANKKPYYHMIWHLFILAAAACHYIAIVFLM